MARRPGTPNKPKAPGAVRPAARAATKAAAPAPVRQTPLPFSPYPDLHMAISMLQKRAGQTSGNRQELITKWVAQLTEIQQEMTKLHKLEQFAQALKPNLNK